MNDIFSPPVSFQELRLKGEAVDRLTRKLGDLREIYHDKDAWEWMDKDQIVYEVESYFPVADGTEGGLFLGMTYIHPGKVGNEYFMTKGHFHQIRNRAEIYCGVEGEGMLLLMDEKGHTRAEKMYPGSLHYIPGHTAHRTANTGSGMFSFGAFWPSDAGHDYDIIAKEGFSKILVEVDGSPALIAN